MWFCPLRMPFLPEKEGCSTPPAPLTKGDSTEVGKELDQKSKSSKRFRKNI